VIIIPDDKKLDTSAIVIIAIAITLTSLTWIGDIFSWAWVANGFIIDGIFLIVALAFTFGTYYLISNLKKKKKLKDFSDDSLISTDEPSKEITFTCFSCGEVLHSKEGLCSVCGSPKPVCVVCYSELHKDDDAVKLPCCSVYAHREHIVNYLEIKDCCPKCQQKFDIKELEDITFG